MFPTWKQGVIAGVFKIKGVSPWAITRAEKLQVSVFLPNEQSMDDWYSGVYALPTVWPDVFMMEINNLRKVVLFYLAHAVRARGSDGHQRFVVGQRFSVCKRTGEMQKAGCLQSQTKQAPKNTNTTNPQQKRHPGI